MSVQTMQVHGDDLLQQAAFLLVEDDPSTVRSISQCLQRAGATRITQAQSVEQAQVLLREQHFDVAILDHNLTGEDTGTALANYMVVQPSLENTLRISYSNAGANAVLKSAYEESFDLVIPKTRSVTHLISEVQALLQLRASR